MLRVWYSRHKVNYFRDTQSRNGYPKRSPSCEGIVTPRWCHNTVKARPPRLIQVVRHRNISTSRKPRAQPRHSTHNASSRLRKPAREPNHLQRKARSRASRHARPARRRIGQDANAHGDRRRSGPYPAQLQRRLLGQWLPKMPWRQLLTRSCLPSPSIGSPMEILHLNSAPDWQKAKVP